MCRDIILPQQPVVGDIIKNAVLHDFLSGDALKGKAELIQHAAGSGVVGHTDGAHTVEVERMEGIIQHQPSRAGGNALVPPVGVNVIGKCGVAAAAIDIDNADVAHKGMGHIVFLNRSIAWIVSIFLAFCLYLRK